MVDAVKDVSSLVDVAPRERFARVCALTGAGISVAAGLGTFRGPDGLWTIAPEVERAMHAHLLPANVDALWSVWGGMWEIAAGAGPTPAHRALAATGASVITQNIDGLHQAAGSADVVELHGSAGRARCLDDDFCGWTGQAHEVRQGDLPGCARCTEPARPAVVLFGEMLDPEALGEARRLVSSCDLFLAVGTSGRVAPASWLAPTARAAGAYCVNIDLHPDGPADPAFHARVVGDAQDVLTEWASLPSP
ncbi:Sir2 family NAD-dependent protein deacetylase [Pseudonocardia sp. MH-G8]|uniref:SIR2 family NAD-dependent protein deacylase n=1 Tax=Pseudonocardia sp. MH-G8 TaxID=1854588 RepID=UPI0013043627|nr:Sir2 family NAD-dependent protein deacetylase [Pseudonocardia sp. MH-G8]